MQRPDPLFFRVERTMAMPEHHPGPSPETSQVSQRARVRSGGAKNAMMRGDRPEAEEGAELLFPGPEFGVREHVAEVCWDLGEACGEERLVRARRWRPHGPGSLPLQRQRT
eukprot:2834482-Rhodomonas_salina.1